MTPETPDLTEEQLSTWERLAAEATPGPWKAERCGNTIEIGAETSLGHLSVAWVQLGDAPTLAEIADGKADAALLAAAREAVPALVAAVRRLREQRDAEAKKAAELEDALKWERVAFESRRVRLEASESRAAEAERRLAVAEALNPGSVSAPALAEVTVQIQAERDEARREAAALREALAWLVRLKDRKETAGKDQTYCREQPLAWDAARAALAPAVTPPRDPDERVKRGFRLGVEAAARAVEAALAEPGLLNDVDEAAEIREYAGLDAAAAATRSLGDDARTVCGAADHPVFVYPCTLPAGHAGPHDNGSGDPWTSPAPSRDAADARCKHGNKRPALIRHCSCWDAAGASPRSESGTAGAPSRDAGTDGGGA